MGDSSPRRTAESKQKAVELYRKSGTTYAEVARGAGWAATRAAWQAGSRRPTRPRWTCSSASRSSTTGPGSARRWAASARRSSRRPIGLRKIAARRRRKRRQWNRGRFRFRGMGHPHGHRRLRGGVFGAELHPGHSRGHHEARSRVHRQLHDERKKVYFLQSFIRMIHGLGYRVVCEGVETREQAGFLREAGCEEAQGFYFARPLPLEEYEA